MKTYTIQEALQLDDGMPVPAIEGKITWVGPITKKKGEHGDWHYQKFMLVDPESTKDDKDSAIFGALKNGDDLTDLKFELVRFECVKGKKGLEGVTKSVREAKGKTYNDLAIFVNPTVLSQDEDAAEPDEEPDGAGEPEVEEEEPAPKKPAPAKPKPSAKPKPKPSYQRQGPVDDDYVPQTLAHMSGAALMAALNDPDADGKPKRDIIAWYMHELYFAREIATETVREEIAGGTE